MGLRIEFAPHLIKLMDPIDQAKFGPGIHPRYGEDHHPPAKSDRLEREEQRQFASYCLFNDLPFSWHATNARSKATPGTPDFWVGINRMGLWIEFKRVGCDLSAEQEKFRLKLECQGMRLYICHTALEAIALLKEFNRVTL